ncbi:hypothetical protein CDES_10490 [Corynebacterium deserti GIMN1.010]|uniref:NIDO domain-containing protein n=1 Tax=Corynebacterium deserti GIMN1.010 TaxID=931089 RepID=A0A0M5IRE2_9CORY|nr:nidogen-like domain-containing protein [Corynebacterium deserti]ALC06474.1 hypothetical protein CDES_10490 [Corynebacterium deserti GIMN1.010]
MYDAPLPSRVRQPASFSHRAWLLLVAILATLALLATFVTPTFAEESLAESEDTAPVVEVESEEPVELVEPVEPDLVPAGPPLKGEDLPASESFGLSPFAIAVPNRPAAPALIDTSSWNLEYLERNDDGSSGLVSLPFPINFAGNFYEALYVNNNGNVTFNSPMSTYTPFALTGQTGVPIIAPFFADIDTRGDGSEVVSFAQSPAGDRFVVNWIDVGYFSGHTDKLVSAQLVLTNRAETTGATGDFDITFNYGSIQWETGDASNGVDGFGGSPVRAGYSLGTGESGTFFEMSGSGETGAMTDGGSRSLFANSLNSLSTPGRYTFEMRADSTGELGGNVSGFIRNAVENPLPGAIISIVANDGTWSSNTISGSDGSYALSGLGTGPALLQVNPPGDTALGSQAVSVVTVAGSPLSIDFTLHGPIGLPPGTTIDQGVLIDDGIPSIYWNDEFTINHDDVPGAEVHFEITQDGRVLAEGTLEEITAGHYSGTVPPLLPLGVHSGPAQVSIIVNGAIISFDIYIDPAGVVVDQHGEPIVGAEVIIYRSDNPDGPFEQIPDGSALLSPSNRTNPDTTDALGRFSWDTVPGYYRVSASAPGYLAEDGSELVWTDVLPIPPEHLDLILVLHGESTEPTSEPTAEPTAEPTPGPSPHAGGSSVLNWILSIFESLGSVFQFLMNRILGLFR